MWQIMCGYLIIAKTRFSCKCYTNGERMNVYTLIIYIMHGPFGDIMLSHDLWLDVGCDFTYAIKVFLIVNVGCNCFIVTNWHFSFNVVFICFENRSQTT